MVGAIEAIQRYRSLRDCVMEQKPPWAYFATINDLEPKVRESNGRYEWIVTNSKTGEELARDEVAGLENAMVGAAQAARAEWGALKWHSGEE